jgi:DNA/RNA endonuclease YhcR with UshA esterase domain
MYNLFLIIILFSFSISETYSWEDGGTILGSYGNLADVENVGETDGVAPYDGDYMLTVSESPIDGTPQAFIAWVTDISEGDQITACFYGYDTTIDAAPSMRIWGSWTRDDEEGNPDINLYAGSADGNEEYTAGTGWGQVCHTFSTSQENWEAGEGLVIQARLYSSSSGPDPTKYFIDLVEVNTTSNTATIHFPEPVEGLIADAGSDQTVDAGSMVTLDGSGSMNTNGDVAAYLWEQTAGIAVSLDDDEAMTTTFAAPNESTTLQFDLSVYDVDGNEESDSVTITVLASAGDLSISDIQGEQNASPYEGQIVSSTGIVTADAEYGFFIQDASGPWNGIWIFDFGNNSINRGDQVEVSGMVEEYNGLTEINITDGSLSIISPNNDLFNSVAVDMLDESHESVLVTVSGTCNSLPDPDYGEWQLGNHTIQNEIYDFDPVLGQEYTITGPVDCYNSQYKVLPRDANDVQQELSNSELIQDFSILNAYPNPFNPTLTIEFSTLSTELIEVSIYDLMGQKIDVLYNGVSQANILNNITWDASNYSSGDYFIYLKTDNFTKTHKITLIK